MTGVKIFYDGTDVFYAQATPFIAAEYNNVYYGELWAKEEVLTFDGKVTGCDYNTIVNGFNNIKNALTKNYQTLEIHQADSTFSGVVYRKELAEIQSINVPNNRWIGIMPYTIKMKCYPSGYYSGAVGILEPKNSWSFSEAENHVATITHTVSCRGTNTSPTVSNALDNAINWANSKRGTGDAVTPAFIQYVMPANFCLLSAKEDIDRLNGTYSIVDTYTNDLARAGYGVIRYSASIDSGVNAITVNLQGTVKGCNRDIDSVRTAFSTFSTSGAAAFLYSGVFNKSDLNPIPLTSSVEEDPYNATITFAYSYDNDNNPETYFDYSVSLTSGNAIGVSIQGDVITRGGDVKTKMIKNKAFAQTVNLYNLAVPFYNAFYPNSASFPLNPRPTSSGIAIHESVGTVSLNAVFNNNNVYSSILDSFDFSIDFNPSVQRFDFQPVLNGLGVYSLVDLGFATRSALAIKGTARISNSASVEDGVTAIQNAIMTLFGQYGKNIRAVLDRNNLSFNRADRRAVSFECQWSFDSATKVSSSPYVSIDNLGV